MLTGALSLDSCVLWADDLVLVRLRLVGLEAISRAAPGLTFPPACSIIGIFDGKTTAFARFVVSSLNGFWLKLLDEL